MAAKSKTKGASSVKPTYPPYGLPFGILPRPFGRPYVPPPMPFFGAYGPFGLPYSAETARKQQLEVLKGQAEYFDGILADIKGYIAELEAEDKKEK